MLKSDGAEVLMKLGPTLDRSDFNSSLSGEPPKEDGVKKTGGNCGDAVDGDCGGGYPRSLLDLLKLMLNLEDLDSEDFLRPLWSAKRRIAYSFLSLVTLSNSNSEAMSVRC